MCGIIVALALKLVGSMKVILLMVLMIVWHIYGYANTGNTYHIFWSGFWVGWFVLGTVKYFERG